VVLLHGEPTVVPLSAHDPDLVAAGHRVIAPDLIGSGIGQADAQGGLHLRSSRRMTRELLLDRLSLVT